MANWRKKAVNATGALGAVGVVLGGAGAIVVEGTTALVRGAMEGARGTGSSASRAALTDALSPENVPIPDEEQGQHIKRRTLAKTMEDVRGPYASGRHGIAQGSKDRAQSQRGRRLELEFGQQKRGQLQHLKTKIIA